VFIWLRDLLLNGVIASPMVPIELRWRLLRALGLGIERCRISARCFIGGPLRIGRGSFINHECFFDASAPIQIGPNCSVGMRVTFITSSHEIGDKSKRAGKGASEPIVVGSGSWVGAGSTILPGVTIGQGCVIAAGSVVTRDCQEGGLYAGNPARLVRELDSPPA